MKILRLVLLFSFLITFSESILAQAKYALAHPLSKSFLVSVEGGGNYYFTDYENSDIGINYGAALEYFFPSNNKSVFGLKLKIAQQIISGNENNLGFKFPADKFNTEAINIGLGVEYSYRVNSLILPFISVGVSQMMLTFDSENIESSFLTISEGGETNNLTNGGETNTLVYEIRGGLKYNINDDFYFNVGVGYNQTLNDNLDAIKYGEFEDSYISGQLGFSYRLWNQKDTDGDGINDKEDKCPFDEEDFDGFQDDDGCPDIDNDGDGINDISDDCQNIAEDLDGFQDDDGCPDIDNDGDGIDDVNDPCPNIAEDLDGYQDDDGCPDADNDSDGILDANDDCVNEAEVFNGYQDDDGCPDELPEPVYIEPEPVVRRPAPVKRTEPKPVPSNAPREFLIHSETTFAPNSAQIKSSANAELNRIAEELKKYPTTNWRIEAHIDKQESRADANRITKSQADAILAYFIRKGLAPSKFQAVGFGDATPISSNNSVYGRMKNRRIILRKLN